MPATSSDSGCSGYTAPAYPPDARFRRMVYPISVPRLAAPITTTLRGLRIFSRFRVLMECPLVQARSHLSHPTSHPASIHTRTKKRAPRKKPVDPESPAKDSPSGISLDGSRGHAVAHDFQEPLGIERGTADQRAVNVRTGHQFRRVVRLDAAAILDAQFRRDIRAI